ncbi:hypothetical protein JCGZ_00938 [Jatropha curcas]|uniref:F-box domain-containing protein n=1 Tax=Jatropha curcas TaxID=180498 RepID=A0A067KSI7_JATCU|nr:hypothetical protein JCGZ_00938 [Jatropha curcas]
MAISSSSSSWSDMPNGLLEQILSRLNNSLDVFRCCNVCTCWRSVATRFYWDQIHFPLLLILHRDEEMGSLCDILTGETQEIFLPKTKDRLICNSTNGWLLTIGHSSPYKVNLWNPISRTEVLLPLASKFPKFNCQRIKQIEGFVKRCITSSLSPLDPNCIVLVIYGLDLERKLAFCRPGDEEWKSLQDLQEVSFDDIMFFKGQFYATDIKGKIYSCDLGPNPKTVIALEPPFHLYPKEKYIVESLSGDFLMINRKWEWIIDDDDGGGGREEIVASFDVYKVDLGTKELKKIETLGNEALFLGYNGCISVSSSKTGNNMRPKGAELPRSNCIYYIHDSFEGLSDVWCGFKRASMYDLESSRIKRLRTSESWTSQFHWFMPAGHQM